MPLPPIATRFPSVFKSIFDPYRYKVFYGGRGAAKSWSIAQYFVMSMLSETHALPVYGCFREVQDSLSDSVKSLIMFIIEDFGLSHEFHTAETSRRITCLRNGGCFLFAGLSNERQVKKLKSTHNLIKAWFEEADGITEPSWDIITPSIRGSDRSEIIVSFNPNLVTDHMWQYFVVNKPPKNSLVVKVNYHDNPYFPDVLEQERVNCLQYPNKYRRIWLGEPGFFEQQLLKPEWWRFYENEKQMLECLTGMFITGDTAYKEAAINDYTVFQCWGYNGVHQLYLIDQIRGKWDFPAMVDAIKRFALQHCMRLHRIVKPARIYIEDKGSGISLVQTLNSEGLTTTAWRPQDFKYPMDKIGRVQESSLIISRGLVHLPKNKPWLGDYLQECNEFSEKGAVSHDDQIDPTTMAISIWRAFGGGRMYRGK